MIIEVTRTYTIEYFGTVAEFITLIRTELQVRHDTDLEQNTLAEAAYNATQCYDQGDLTGIVDETDYTVKEITS